MIPSNFEARKFGEGRSHAEALAQWCGGTTYLDDQDQLFMGVPDNRVAWPGDWIIRPPEGTFRVDGPGSQDGYCADCGVPVWWHRGKLLDSPGDRWCYGPGHARGWARTHEHALPGMHQCVAQAAEGQVCRCLARREPHIHRIELVPDPAGPGTCGQCDHGLVPAGHCNCDTGPEGQHQPLCGLEPCPAGCWDRLHVPVGRNQPPAQEEDGWVKMNPAIGSRIRRDQFPGALAEASRGTGPYDPARYADTTGPDAGKGA